MNFSPMSPKLMQTCCCFSTSTLHGDECFRTCLCRYHPTAQLHLGFLRKPWVTLLLHLYWSSCLIIHVLLNLQVHTWACTLQVQESLSRIFHRSIMEEIDLLGCSPRISYHWFVCYWMLCCRAKGFCIIGSLQQWYGCSYEKSLVVVPCQMAL